MRFTSFLGWYIIYTNLLPTDRILPRAKGTLRPILVFSHTGSITARHSSSGHQPNFAAWYKEWNYGAFAEGVTYVFGWAAIMLGICPHSSYLCVNCVLAHILCIAAVPFSAACCCLF